MFYGQFSFMERVNKYPQVLCSSRLHSAERFSAGIVLSLKQSGKYPKSAQVRLSLIWTRIARAKWGPLFSIRSEERLGRHHFRFRSFGAQMDSWSRGSSAIYSISGWIWRQFTGSAISVSGLGDRCALFSISGFGLAPKGGGIWPGQVQT